MEKGGDVEISGTARDVNSGIQVFIDQYVAAGHKPPPDLADCIKRYLESLREQTRSIKLRGINSGAVDLDLGRVYLDLTAVKRLTATADLSRRSQRERSGDDPSAAMTLPTSQVLAQGRYLAVTGGPGSGKSTVLQHAAWVLSSAILAEDRTMAKTALGLSGDLPLPIFLPLNRYAEYRAKLAGVVGQERKLARFISLMIAERYGGTGIPEDFFELLLTKGRHLLLLLDGLDEVPSEAERKLVSQAMEDLRCACPDLQLVITCRTRAYTGEVLSANFQEIQVQDLNPEQVATLVRAIHAEVYPEPAQEGQRDEQSGDLLRGIEAMEADRRSRLGNQRALVVSPLLVRLVVIVHLNERKLPHQRAELYEKVVASLLTADHHLDAEVAARMAAGHRERLAMLQAVALRMHSLGKDDGREVHESVLRDWLREHLKAEEYCDDLQARDRADAFISVERARAGLLECLAGQWRFTHLSFQEFLAARRLTTVATSPEAMYRFLEEDARCEQSWWREVALLTVGYLFLEQRRVALALIEVLASFKQQVPVRSATTLAAAELAATAALEWQAPQALLDRLALQLASFLFSNPAGDALPTLRALAGNALAALGDPRFDPLLWHLPADPLLGFVHVPAGSFLIGSDKSQDTDASSDESPERGPHKGKQHPVTTGEYYIARYPVTVAQFRAFVEDKAGNSGFKPGDLDCLRGRPNHPVVWVNWNEAVAYCHWLTAKLQATAKEKANGPSGVGSEAIWRGLADGRLRVTLPTEAQWERAARGDDGQSIYPWQGPFDHRRGNTSGSGIGGSSSVGIFPEGASPVGCLDMAGNVWEWTSSLYKPYPYNHADGREYGETSEPRVLRGGSWSGSPQGARAAYRHANHPDGRNGSGGFRVVVAGFPIP